VLNSEMMRCDKCRSKYFSSWIWCFLKFICLCYGNGWAVCFL